MPPTEVLITFYCRTGETERLALAAAVGAVQARATIRLRRLADTVAATPDCHEALTRMCKEYVPPTDADILRADAIIFVAPAGFRASAPEWRPYLTALRNAGSEGRLSGKTALVLSSDAGASKALAKLVRDAGIAIAPSSSDDALEQGRELAVRAGALKKERSGR